MDTIMKYLKSIGYMLASIAIMSIIIGTFNYFNIINTNTTNILEIIALYISIFVGSFYLGRNSSSKGYLEGLKIGIIFVIILGLINYLILGSKFQPLHLLSYLLVVGVSVLGSILGINKKN